MSKKIVLTLCCLFILFSFTTLAIASTPEQNAREDRAVERHAREERGPGINCDECDGEEVRLQKQVREERRLEEGENGARRQVGKQQRQERFSTK